MKSRVVARRTQALGKGGEQWLLPLEILWTLQPPILIEIALPRTIYEEQKERTRDGKKQLVDSC